DVLVKHLKAESLDYHVQLDESVVARLFYRIQLPSDWRGYDSLDHQGIEDDLVMAVRSGEEGGDMQAGQVFGGNSGGEAAWEEGVKCPAVTVVGETSGVEAAQVWDDAFPPNYRVRFEIDDAMEDISRFTALTGKHPAIYLVPTAIGARMKIYSTKPITLTTLMPILGELGLEV